MTRRWLGEPLAAVSHFRALVEEDPGNVHYLGYLGLALAASGRTEEARDVDARLAQWPDPYARGSDLYWRAVIAARLGERDHAMALLEDAVAHGYGISSLLENENLRPLWGYPTFQRLIEPKV